MLFWRTTLHFSGIITAPFANFSRTSQDTAIVLKLWINFFGMFSSWTKSRFWCSPRFWCKLNRQLSLLTSSISLVNKTDRILFGSLCQPGNYWHSKGAERTQRERKVTAKSGECGSLILCSVVTCFNSVVTLWCWNTVEISVTTRQGYPPENFSWLNILLLKH